MVARVGIIVVFDPYQTCVKSSLWVPCPRMLIAVHPRRAAWDTGHADMGKLRLMKLLRDRGVAYSQADGTQPSVGFLRTLARSSATASAAAASPPVTPAASSQNDGA